jgi:hypothetical protein
MPLLYWGVGVKCSNKRLIFGAFPPHSWKTYSFHDRLFSSYYNNCSLFCSLLKPRGGVVQEACAALRSFVTCSKLRLAEECEEIFLKCDVCKCLKCMQGYRVVVFAFKCFSSSSRVSSRVPQEANLSSGLASFLGRESTMWHLILLIGGY